MPDLTLANLTDALRRVDGPLFRWTEDFGRGAEVDLWLERLGSAVTIAAALTLVERYTGERPPL